MALSQIKAFLGELASVNRLQGVQPCATFYAEDDFSYLTMEGYVQGLLQVGRPVAYVTSDPKDTVMQGATSDFHPFALPRLGLAALGKCQTPLLVMTMPDLGSLHVARPAKTTRCVYLFHSLLSVHRAYRTDAFDHYDDFFCTGHYQVRELTRRFEILGKPCPRLHQVGYYKLDRVHRLFLSHEKMWTDRPTVLLAPSWHTDNLLESVGLEMVERLLAADLRVVVRPHPAFFTPVYPSGKAVVASVEQRFCRHPNFVLDTTMNSEQYFHEADLLITDWSGSAFEYALGTERPVLFVDTPPKSRNERWEEYGIVPFEVAMREKVGRTMRLDEAPRTATIVSEMLHQSEAYREALTTLREAEIFHFGRSSEVGTKLLLEFLAEHAG